MLIRRTLLVAAVALLLWASPAHAAPSFYAATTVENQDETGIVLADEPETIDQAGADLARTGQDNIKPLVQLSMVLIGAGATLVLIDTRHRTGGHRRQRRRLLSGS